MLDIVILTVRPKEKDFRFALHGELVQQGHRVEYIFLKSNPQVISSETLRCVDLTFMQFLRHMAGMRRAGRRPVFFNSTNLAFPELSVILRLVAGGQWIFDMHDDLLYDLGGIRRLIARVRQGVVLAASHQIVHAAPALKQLFPRSEHLGNGSSLQPLPKLPNRHSHILVMASFDGRFDFDFMRAVAFSCPQLSFDLYGHLTDNAGVRESMAHLLEVCGNIHHFGAYDEQGLPALLAQYNVSFAPYKVGHLLTQYIDPLRFYHCLASGTAIVSTAIPQALAMWDQIIVVQNPDEVAKAIERSLSLEVKPARSWYQVAQRLTQIIRAYNT